jgi:hypothetical protein
MTFHVRDRDVVDLLHGIHQTDEQLERFFRNIGLIEVSYDADPKGTTVHPVFFAVRTVFGPHTTKQDFVAIVDQLNQTVVSDILPSVCFHVVTSNCLRVHNLSVCGQAVVNNNVSRNHFSSPPITLEA